MVQNPTGGLVTTKDLIEGSPDAMFRFFLFHRWDIFLDAMMEPEKINVDAAVASLLATCTDRTKRHKFFNDYLVLKQKLRDEGKTETPELSAAILTGGDFFAYIAILCGFIEEETAGFG